MALIYISGAWVAGILVGALVNLPLALILLGLVPLPLLVFRHRRRAIGTLTGHSVVGISHRQNPGPLRYLLAA